jgi:hypothetical protein
VGSARFLDWGHAILEAQFDPRLLFEYKNIAPDSRYNVTGTKNPWATVITDNVVNLKPGKVNDRYFEEIDLKPFLNKG